jgi:YHS domain-containing protein
MVKSVEVEHTFADGDDVCAILTLVVDHAIERFQMVEWYRCSGDRLESVQTFFDTGPFIRRSVQSAQKAIDPVCGMGVDPGAPEATRAHQGRTYHFCSQGCAIAFEDEPARYLGPG